MTQILLPSLSALLLVSLAACERPEACKQLYEWCNEPIALELQELQRQHGALPSSLQHSYCEDAADLDDEDECLVNGLQHNGQIEDYRAWSRTRRTQGR